MRTVLPLMNDNYREYFIAFRSIPFRSIAFRTLVYFVSLYSFHFVSHYSKFRFVSLHFVSHFSIFHCVSISFRSLAQPGIYRGYSKFFVEHFLYFTTETGFFCIFSRMRIKKSRLTREINIIFNKRNIECSVYFIFSTSNSTDFLHKYLFFEISCFLFTSLHFVRKKIYKKTPRNFLFITLFFFFSIDFN